MGKKIYLEFTVTEVVDLLTGIGNSFDEYCNLSDNCIDESNKKYFSERAFVMRNLENTILSQLEN